MPVRSRILGRRPTLIAASLTLAALLVACAPALTAAEVRPQMLSYLAAWNSGDYDKWTENWSTELLASTSREEWTASRDQAYRLTGRFVSIDELSSAPEGEGFTRWTALCTFEEVQLVFAITMPTTGGEVVAVYLDAYQPSPSPGTSQEASPSASP